MEPVLHPDVVTARRLISKWIQPLAPAFTPLEKASGLVAARDVSALVDSPSLPCARRDGIALRSSDAVMASPEHPVHLPLAAPATAGRPAAAALQPGQAAPIATGAVLPLGADAVLASENCSWIAEGVRCTQSVPAGKNVIPRGRDVSAGDRLITGGTCLMPAVVGLLTAGGVAGLHVTPRPRVALLSTGSELVSPGSRLLPGQLYASNLATLVAWAARFPVTVKGEIVPDDVGALERIAAKALPESDILIISGGTMNSAGDVTLKALKALGGRLVFRGVRMRPGKSTALVWLAGKPVFCLPGGPPGCEMAFLQLALPAILTLGGQRPPPLPLREARLTVPLETSPDFTRFLQGRLLEENGCWRVEPVCHHSRLVAQAAANAIITLEEGGVSPAAGESIVVQGYGFP
jgi:molybdopterin molybdotransferase